MALFKNRKEKIKWDKKAKFVQTLVQKKAYDGRPVNSYEPFQEPGDREKNGVRILNDLQYGTEYPNSYLDLMIPAHETGETVPLILYFHGGGFLFGSKSKGDPLAAGNVAEAGLFERLLEEGYAIASADYALAPEYRFPVPFRQVDEALHYLIRVSDRYGLDRDRIALMGSSAGAEMVEIYCAARSNPSYANELGLDPAELPMNIRAVIIDESALALPYRNDNMDTMLGAFLGENDLEASPNAELCKAHQFIREGFPPTFITASNEEPFFKASQDALIPILNQLDIEVRAFYPEPERYGKVPHGFLAQVGSTASEDAMGILTFFLKERFSLS